MPNNRGEDGKFAGNGEGHRTPKEVQAVWDKEKEQRKKKGEWSGFTRMAKEEQSKGSWVNYYSAYAREKEKEKINMPNNNVLAGMCCPKCKSEGPFAIQAQAEFVVSDDGTGEYSDVDWDDDSHTRCLACKHRGQVKNFRATRSDRVEA